MSEPTKKDDCIGAAQIEVDTVHQDAAILDELPIAVDHGQAASYSLQSIWHQIFWVLSGEKTIEELCRNYDADRVQLERWLLSANWLFSLKKSENGDERRHRFKEWNPDKRSLEENGIIACPVMPHENRDLFVASRLETAYWLTYAQDAELVRRVVRHYVLEARDNFGGLIFLDSAYPEEAQEFLAFLKHLGLKANEITFVSFDLKSKRAGPSAKWRKALGLHSTVKIVQRAPLNGRNDWACPWLGIVPVFEGTKRPRLDTKEASAGFRFLMLMAAISMGMAG